MSHTNNDVNLLDNKAFELANGLWKGKKPPFIEAGVIRNTNFTRSGRIDLTNVAVLPVEKKQLKTRSLQPGDIVVERSGGGPKQPVGRVVYFEEAGGVWSFSNFTSRIRVRDRNRFDPKFVFYRLMYFYASGATDSLQRRTTGIRNLDWKAYKETVCVPAWSLGDQRHIAAVLTIVQRAEEQKERLIVLTAELKEVLMYRLFSRGTRGEAQKETEVGPIPQSWQLVDMRSLFSVPPNNGLYKPRSLYGDGTLILRIDDFSNDGDTVVSAGNRLQADLDDLRRYGLAANDIVVNRVNSLSHLGKTALVGTLLEPMLFESNMMRFRVNEQKVRPDYAFRFLNSPSCKKQIIGRAKRAVAQSSINQGDVSSLRVPLPPLDEQEEIVNVLSCTAVRIEEHCKAKNMLEDLFRTLLQQLMTAAIRVDRLDLSELEPLGIEVD